MIALDVATDSGLPATLLVLLPLIGTLVGGGIAALAAWLTAKKNQQTAKLVEGSRHDNTMKLERTRYEREDQRRWDNHIRELCAKMVALDHRLSIRAWRIGEDDTDSISQRLQEIFAEVTDRDNYPQHKTEVDKLMNDYRKVLDMSSEMMDLKSDMYVCLAEIKLVAPKEIADSASKFYGVSFEREPDSDEGYEQAHSVARDEFMSTVKRVIGSPTASSDVVKPV